MPLSETANINYAIGNQDSDYPSCKNRDRQGAKGTSGLLLMIYLDLVTCGSYIVCVLFYMYVYRKLYLNS